MRANTSTLDFAVDTAGDWNLSSAEVLELVKTPA